MSYRQATPSVRRTNVPRDTFVEEPSGINYIISSKSVLNNPALIQKWQDKVQNLELMVFKAENCNANNINVKSLKSSIYKYRRYLSIPGAYEEDCVKNNNNSKLGCKSRGILETLIKSCDLNIDLVNDSKVDIIRELSIRIHNLDSNDITNMELNSDDEDDDSSYSPSVQSDDSEENRNNVRQMARQSYEYESDGDDSTYIGSDSTVSTVTSADMDIDYQLV